MGWGRGRGRGRVRVRVRVRVGVRVRVRSRVRVRGRVTSVILTKSRKSGEALVSSASTGGGPLTMHIITW